MSLKKPLTPDEAFMLTIRVGRLAEAFMPELLANDRAALVAILTVYLTDPDSAYWQYGHRFNGKAEAWGVFLDTRYMARLMGLLQTEAISPSEANGPTE